MSCHCWLVQRKRIPRHRRDPRPRQPVKGGIGKVQITAITEVIERVLKRKHRPYPNPLPWLSGTWNSVAAAVTPWFAESSSKLSAQTPGVTSVGSALAQDRRDGARSIRVQKLTRKSLYHSPAHRGQKGHPNRRSCGLMYSHCHTRGQTDYPSKPPRLYYHTAHYAEPSRQAVSRSPI